MADTVLPKPEPQALGNLLRAQALALHARDVPPTTLKEWEEHKARLRQAVAAARGPFPEQHAALEPKVVGVLQRQGYVIEKVLFQSRPDVWVTATAYVPQPRTAKVPAVLVVHGHWPWARRDPVVQARCLGLVKLGFFVLAVDAFGAGERYTEPARGTYHGALYGSTLWPAGHTLLGLQLYDNQRAVDFLRSRPEVDGDRLGVTGASGGGNQTMYAGALDERFRAVVPVCSVGTYQSYLHAACCVCELLPGALRFAEESDMLGLTAPRALLVINATRDAFQFSVGEAQKSLARTVKVYQLYSAADRLKHAVFESPHDYNQAMREAMYGWMTRWLKEEGKGEPIPEPKHEVEKVEDLSCFPDGKRPKSFLFPPSFAAREAAALVAKHNAASPDHVEAWDATAVYMRGRLRREIFGDFPQPPKPDARLGKAAVEQGVATTPVVLHPEPGLPLPVVVRSKEKPAARQPACVLLHLDGKAQALGHPVAAALVANGWLVAAPDLRGTGETAPGQDAIRGAPDHNSAEHALWVGRPLLGQWVFDVSCVLDWLALQPGLDRRRFAVVGVGQAGIVAVCAGGLFDDRVASVAALDAPTTYVTDQEYASGTRMGLLVPGILRVGDVPHLAALTAPRRLVLAGGVTPQGKALPESQLTEAFKFTSTIYQLHKAKDRLALGEKMTAEDVARSL